MTPVWNRKATLCLATLLVAILTVTGTCGSRARAEIAFQYSFNADSEVAVPDSRGQGLTAQIHGARPVPSANGYALQFDGKDDYIELPNRPVLNSPMFSWELWIHATAGGPLLAKKG
jgi:hypothetical protein